MKTIEIVGPVRDVPNPSKSTKVPSMFSPMDVSGLQHGPVRRYYEDQNELIGLIGNISGDCEDQSEDSKDHPDSYLVGLAINLSYAANILLLILKIWALAISGSMAMLASVLDSCLDILSGSILYCASRIIEQRDKYKYPIGKQRVQPISTIVFACLMGMSALQIFIESLRTLAIGLASDSPAFVHMNVIVYGIVFITIGLKAGLAVLCYSANGIRKSSTLMAYAQDHVNDTITNGVGVAGMIIAAQYKSMWYVDPVVAMVLATWIVYNWASTGRQLTKLIIGRTASPMFLQYLTYIALHHDPNIQAVDTVRAYYMGESLFVEVDVVLDENMALKETHDIGESLQIKIEEVSDVERCFVHLDYEYSHSPEHKVA